MVLDVGLVGVLVDLDDEAVARLIVHWVDHARKCNCDWPCVAGIGCEYVGDRDEARVCFDHAVRVEGANKCFHDAVRVFSHRKTDLKRVRDGQTRG